MLATCLLIAPALAAQAVAETPNGCGSALQASSSCKSVNGYILLGTTRYAMHGQLSLQGGELAALELSVVLGSTPATIKVARGNGPSVVVTSANGTRIERADLLAVWGKALLSTADELERTGMYARSVEAEGVVLESKSTVEIAPCFPVKVQYFFLPMKEGATPGGPCQVAFYSLAEWNNPFHENVVMHLFMMASGKGVGR